MFFLIYDGSMEEKPLKEIAEVVRSVVRRKITESKYPQIYNEGGIMIKKKVSSNEIMNELDKAINERDEKKAAQIIQTMYKTSVFEEIYLYRLPPIDKKYGAARKVEVTISSSQSEDDAMLHQLLQ